jgi:hypothetical protein
MPSRRTRSLDTPQRGDSAASEAALRGPFGSGPRRTRATHSTAEAVFEHVQHWLLGGTYLLCRGPLLEQDILLSRSLAARTQHCGPLPQVCSTGTQGLTVGLQGVAEHPGFFQAFLHEVCQAPKGLVPQRGGPGFREQELEVQARLLGGNQPRGDTFGRARLLGERV